MAFKEKKETDKRRLGHIFPDKFRTNMDSPHAPMNIICERTFLQILEYYKPLHFYSPKAFLEHVKENAGYSTIKLGIKLYPELAEQYAKHIMEESLHYNKELIKENAKV